MGGVIVLPCLLVTVEYGEAKFLMLHYHEMEGLNKIYVDRRRVKRINFLQTTMEFRSKSNLKKKIMENIVDSCQTLRPRSRLMRHFLRMRADHMRLMLLRGHIQF